MLGSPLENHWINIAKGKVESLSERPASPVTKDLGENTVILPAAVNTHAHLELSQLTSPLEVPSRSMPDWIPPLLAFRRSAGYDAVQGIQQAMHRPELLESTIAVADIIPPMLKRADGRQQTAADAIDSVPSSAAGLHWLPFAELIAWRSEAANNISCPHTFGLSPHAPHTVCPALLEKAIKQNVPIAMHLAETPAELQLLRHHTGPLVEMMRHADPDYDPKSVLVGKRPFDYLQLLSAAPSVLIVHGNYLDDEELRFLAAHRDRMSVVYCPRSHAYFRHTPYPLQKMLDYGVRVLLGTDSLASTPNLSLAEEMQWVLQYHPTIPAEQVYRLGTLEGATALGLPRECGTIQPGSPARFIVLHVKRGQIGRFCSAPTGK